MDTQGRAAEARYPRRRPQPALGAPRLSASNTTYNLNSPLTWARFTGTIGDFSNFSTAQANMQLSFRTEF